MTEAGRAGLHACRRQRHGHPLRATESFVQEGDAEHDIQQRVDEVAQAALDHVAGIHRPDVQGPVRPDQQAAERERYSQLELQFAGELHRLRGDLRAIGLMLADAGEEFEPLLPLARAKGLDSLMVRQAVLRILSR